MITTFLFLMVYTGIVGATGFLMGRVFYRNEKQLRKIETRLRAHPEEGFAKDAENIHRDWKRVLGAVSQKKP
jgi:hypothetical protein